jgi:hypothetical protein
VNQPIWGAYPHGTFDDAESNTLEVRRGQRDLIPVLHRHLHLVDARREPKKT